MLLPQFLWPSLCEILHSSLITNVKENCVEYNDGEDDAVDNYIDDDGDGNYDINRLTVLLRITVMLRQR